MNRQDVKQINKKLLIIFFMMLALFTTLLVVKVQALNVSSEIESLKQSDRGDPTYLTYNDLIDYYDILCCQHGTPLPGQGQVTLSGSHSQGSFSYDMGYWGETGYSKGSKIESHKIYYQGNDFDKSSYTHRTYGYYSIVEKHIATPKEAYIIAEMKKELDVTGSNSAVELTYYNGQPQVYTGSATAMSYTTSTGETVYVVDQKYILDTGSGVYYVNQAMDASGNLYYVYETNADGSLKVYTGNYTRIDPKTGETVQMVGSHTEEVYYEYNGTLRSGDVVASSQGTVYLADYKTVVDRSGVLYYCYVTNDYNYIQIAWWTTDMGTSHSTVQPSAPNSLSKEAEAFEEYILKIAGKSSVEELTYEVQSYDFYEEDGTHSVGSVTAPVIEYNPYFYSVNAEEADRRDVDHNGVVNEADEITPSFDHDKQTYIVGPFSIYYVKESAHIAGRNSVDFSAITGTKLVTNVGELELGKDWNFKFLTDQARDLNEAYPYPNPDEVFYLEINYIEDLTEIQEFTFDFKYMNAGAELDIYDGTYNDVTWTVKYKDTTHEDDDGDEVFDYRDIWLECTSVIAHDVQTLAHGLIGARWYNYKSISTEFGIRSATITLEKKTYDKTGSFIVPVDRTFLFKVYINETEFQNISITTKNGYGTATTNRIVWSKDQAVPSYKVEEIGNYTNNGPWTGTLKENANIVLDDIKNFIEPKKGTLEIDKKLLNPTPALESEEFHFTVTVTGRFSYNDGPVEYHSANNPLTLDVTIIGAGKWNSGEFKWYGAAPKYKVVENIPDNATYELVNGVIANGNGYLQDNTNKVATATNKPTTDWTVIEIDKKLVSETEPQPGEVFTADLTITGKFSYNNDEIQERTMNFTVVLDQSNNWKWESAKIVWNEDEVPTYTLKEVQMAEGTSFVSISDEVITSLVNDFSSKLNPEKTLVVITNDRVNQLIGRIQINKLVETEDLNGKTFYFDVEVTGTFKYQGTQYTNQTITFSNVPVTVGSDGVGSWKSEIFSWEEGKTAPNYKVTEVNLPADSKFVSISNGTTTNTSTQTVSGILNGVVGDPNDADAKAGKVIITCTNTGTAKKQAHIVIIKESTDESIDDYVFFFKVTLTGTFRYYDVVNADGTIGYTQYTNETLVLDGKINDVEAVCGGEDWVSELIVWDEMDPAPTYTVEEISIPANIEFVSISNRIKTSTSTKIDGTLAEGTENNYITAINKPGPDFVDGSIRIVKKSSEDLKGKLFKFDLKVTGEFDYAGKHYGSGSENGDTYTLEGIEVEANGNPWISGIFNWDAAGSAPTYEVKEVDLPAGSHFVSISNEKEVKTDSSMTITGNLSLTKPVKVVAINYGDIEPNGSHIEITKEVLNEKLKGTNFYFNVQVTSTSPFRYHDLEDATKVTNYNAGDVVEFKNVVAVADEKDWVSGYFEWDEGAAVPTYTISEITSAFPNKVKSVSLRNDTSIIVKELTNASGEDLVITGSLAGDITHIIAVNDADEETPVQGKIVIEKQALSEIIEGEEFTFTLTIEGKFKYNGQDYRKLEIKDIKITANGPKWESEIIEWYEKDGAPTYTVTEDTAVFADGTKFVSIRNAYQTNTQPAITGTVEPHFNNWVIAENTFDGYDKGRIQIHKVLLDSKGNQIDGVDFTFKVIVTFKDKDGNVTTQEDEVTVTSGGYWRSAWYSWSKKDSVPTYHIEEINHDGYQCTIDKPDGDLIAQDTENGVSGIVSVNTQNTYEEEHQAQIRVNKELVLNDKMSTEDVTVSFTALVKVTGSFTYKGKAYNDEALTLKITLSKDTNWTWLSDVIKWNGDEAPYFIVEEPESEIPAGWHLVSTESSPSDNRLVDGGTAVVDIKNEWKYQEELILTMKLGGKVWDDTNRTLDKHVDALENGVIDDGEPGIANVKVTIYRALVNKANGQVVQRLDGVYAYDENNLMTRVENVTYTDNNGNWSFGAVSVPAFIGDEKDTYGDSYSVTYDVEFEYDGQTYEPTEFLATAGGESSSYVGANASNNMYSDVANRWATIINSSTSERDKYLYDSMAIDKLEDRTAFNNSFADIQGKEPIDDDGNTVGTTGSGKELNYTSVDSVSFFNSDNSRKISTLRTLNDDDEIYEDLRISAATSNSNLTFPFYNDDPNYNVTAWHLRGWDKTITDVFKITYKFEAVYNYCLSINLGLVEREGADLAVEKDLTEALVVVNGKALKYKFNAAIDLEDPDYTELLYKQLAVADAQIEYKLGLYKGDYYYRASVYDGSDAGSALQGFYTTKLGLPLDTSEMEIYLKYTINVYNQSETYNVTVGEVADYYDSTFKLIDATESRYVQNLNGKEVDSVIEVASPSSVTYFAGTNEIGNNSVSWVKVADYEGSDGVKYGKLTTSSLSGKQLGTGERATITVTFKIEKDAIGDSGVLNTIKLGKKHNVAEVTKFTSYYSDKSENRWSTPGQIAGRVDEDSAPDNVNIQYYNDKAYYEDDTDSAPIITIGISDESRAVSGIVWDDAQTQSAGYGQIVGDGYYNPDQGDKLINDLTTEIYESITVPETTDNGETVYREYQFAWPTETPIAALGNHTIAELTGFHQATVTENGEYSFINLPAGNYKVRYVYGDKQILTGKSGSEEVYNGQDYKTTAYQIGFNNDRNNDGYVDNEWHDISNEQLSDLRVNDARDDEARRLYISAKSEMLTFDNTSLLITADDKNADHTELFGNYQDVRNNPVTGEGYYMYAETAKINLGVENIYKVNYTTETINNVDVGSIYGNATQNGRDVGNPKFTYNIKNIDCGIEERSQTKITLDKQIKQITLMTSDNKVILDAIYDINYTLKPDGSISSTVTLNKDASTGIDHIASLNRRGAYDQGYRYIIAEGTILQGTQIQVKYQLTAFNMSETDRISKDLETLWSVINTAETQSLKDTTLQAALNKVSTTLYTESKGRVYNDGTGFTGIGYGTYFGSVYYLGSQGVGVRADETIVKTKIHQMIDYIDPDVEFTDMQNISRDQSWSNTEIAYLLDNHLIDPSIVQILDSQGRVTGETAADRTLNSGERYSIISDKLQEYRTDMKNNLVLTIDNGASGDTGTNPGFVKFLEPYMANSNVERSTGSIGLYVSRFYSSELDASDIDNLAEIIKIENTAGRRDARNVAGNANPYELEGGEPVGIYAAAQGKEKDASATEVITLSPPTGLNADESRTMQLILVVLISVTLVAVAIVIIKKKVLIKK
ncbi:MAG: hypothetical protein IJ629_00550 [Clostridia bacterium]|nr:hypothetical protein [Clostridia bacterium]